MSQVRRLRRVRRVRHLAAHPARRVPTCLVVAGLVVIASCSSDPQVVETTDTIPNATDTAPIATSAVAAPDIDDTGANPTGPTGTGVDVVATTTTETTATPEDIVTRSPDAVGDGVRPEGFTTVDVRITSSDGRVCEVCMWLADAGPERQRGLMGVTDLGDPVGMVFEWSTPVTGNFVMVGTPTPLSIAWFGADGAHVSQSDMTPCLDRASAECERYPAAGPYTLAIEMFEGQLDAVGIGPGSVVEIITRSDTERCPL